MNLDALRMFVALVEESTFRTAAERVHRSQPALSQQLKKLEGELGQTLFDRKAGAPTPAGELVYRRAQALLRRAEGLTQELADFDEGVGRELRIGTSDTNALYFLPPFLREFSKKFPQTRLALTSRPSDDIGELVLRGKLDLGIVTFPVSHDGLEGVELFEHRLVLVAPKGHALAGRRRVALSRLRDESFLLLHEDTRTGRALREFFRQKKFEPKVVLDSGSFEVIKRYVAEGIGLAFLPETVVTDHDVSLVTVHVSGLPTLPMGAIWPRGMYQIKAARSFLDILRG